MSIEQKRVVIYCRTATMNEGSTLSLETQRERCEKFCERRRYEVVEVVTDERQSAAKIDRPGLNRVRELVQAGNVDAVVTLQQDRLARQVNHLLVLFNEAKEAGVLLVFVIQVEADEVPLFRSV